MNTSKKACRSQTEVLYLLTGQEGIDEKNTTRFFPVIIFFAE